DLLPAINLARLTVTVAMTTRHTTRWALTPFEAWPLSPCAVVVRRRTSVITRLRGQRRFRHDADVSARDHAFPVLVANRSTRHRRGMRRHHQCRGSKAESQIRGARVGRGAADDLGPGASARSEPQARRHPRLHYVCLLGYTPAASRSWRCLCGWVSTFTRSVQGARG